MKKEKLGSIVAIDTIQYKSTLVIIFLWRFFLIIYTHVRIQLRNPFFK